ncbi:MAG: DUF3160 domain-containing protein [Fibrobacteres bacterium]|nr:DUF3160 domain-containing protein [Fibrobacterota bacterium]
MGKHPPFARPASRIPFWICVLALCFPAFARGGDFSGLPEPSVSPSPDSATRLPLAPGDKVVDLDADPRGGRAAVLIESAGGRQTIRMWDFTAAKPDSGWPVPPDVRLQSLAWHPLGVGLFLLGRKVGKAAVSVILAWDPAAPGKPPECIYATGNALRRLVAGPRPFITGQGRDSLAYRLFFGAKGTAGYAIRSITEYGKSPYQAIGSALTVTGNIKDEEAPSQLIAAYALPLGFHPAGHLMLWQDSAGCFEVAEYYKGWANSHAVPGKPCGGTLTATPNGMGLLHWRPGKPGVELLGRDGRSQGTLAPASSFAFTPSSTPDGKGLLGVLAAENVLAYIPVKVPLADVVNAWMFAETPEDQKSLISAGALFRNSDFAQMYNLYDTENYGCGDGYDREIPTRPYLVTTDIFWEVYAAAYEGVFTLAERKSTLHAFWDFITAASEYYRRQAPRSYWDGVFGALAAFKAGRTDAFGEAPRILAAQGSFSSRLLGGSVDYGELKPRGHYASDDEFRAYFKGFMYLTRLASDTVRLAELRSAPPDLKAKALAWIHPYRSFIAPSRSPLVWDEGMAIRPAFGGAPRPAVFPLSWGMDNEILNSTVYHKSWPPERQIMGPKGQRVLSAGVDLPAALGNPLALTVLAEDRAAYPNLDAVLRELRTRPWPPEDDSANLYDRWMGALRTQWADAPALPGGAADWRTWPAKRLQTGLASWATLRHATVLVNERTGAECGEGGYEEMIQRPPRGFVEPDPLTFAALAGLFEATAAKVPAARPGAPEADRALGKGLRERLLASALAARRMQEIADKELHGVALDDSEYEDILTIGRVAEHHFLLYKSIGSEDDGLINPDPIPKIIDVASGPDGYRFAAVGHPLEWDQMVPYFGRREMVKGAVYSYYEFAGPHLYDDKEWQAELVKRNRPDWIRPFITNRSLRCPPRAPF